MNPEINFNQLWKEQNIVSFDKDLVFQKINLDIKEKSRRKISTILLLLTTALLLSFIWFFISPVFLITKIGFTFCIFSITSFLFLYFKSFKLLVSIAEINSNRIFIQRLNHWHKIEKQLGSLFIDIYLISLFVGVILGMYEFVFKMPSSAKFIIYLSIVIWFILIWFIVRPGIVKIQNEEMSKLIDEMNKITRQIVDSEI